MGKKDNKNNLMKNLELLSILDDYVIEGNDKVYTIECNSYCFSKFNQLCACIDKETYNIAYYMKGVCNNLCDSIEERINNRVRGEQ